MPFSFPSSLNLASTPTPFYLLKRLTHELNGPRVWIKRDDLTGSLLSGNKVRKLNFLLAHALKNNCDTIITCGGVQSNHCRATAFACAQLGLKACLILRDDGSREVDGNLFLDQLSGAHVEIYDRLEYTKKLNQLFKQWKSHYESLGHNVMTIPTGASNDVGVWGYVEAAKELIEDFKREEITPTSIYVATGSGGTQAGLTAGMHCYKQKDINVVGVAVCDNEAYFQQKVRGDITAWKNSYQIDIDVDDLSILVNDKYIGPGYAKASESTYDIIKWMAQIEGIALDPVYTGKAFQGLIEEIKQGKHQAHEDVVFIHTGGLFGLFAQRQKLHLD